MSKFKVTLEKALDNGKSRMWIADLDGDTVGIEYGIEGGTMRSSEKTYTETKTLSAEAVALKDFCKKLQAKLADGYEMTKGNLERIEVAFKKMNEKVEKEKEKAKAEKEKAKAEKEKEKAKKEAEKAAKKEAKRLEEEEMDVVDDEEYTEDEEVAESDDAEYAEEDEAETSDVDEVTQEDIDNEVAELEKDEKKAS